MGTVVLEASDSSCGETMISDWYHAIGLCLVQHLPESASWKNIKNNISKSVITLLLRLQDFFFSATLDQHLN